MKTLDIASEVLEGIDVPVAPLPWQPLERMQRASAFFFDVLRASNSKGAPDPRPQLREYGTWLQEHYLIPGPAVAAIDGSFTLSEEVLSNVAFANRGGEAVFDDSVRRFEQDYLGMPPNSSKDGLYFWITGSGFGGGYYPAEYVARQVNLSPEQLMEWADANEDPVGNIKVKADDWLFSVKTDARSRETGNVIVGEIYELTVAGNGLLTAILSAYAKGLEHSSRVSG